MLTKERRSSLILLDCVMINQSMIKGSKTLRLGRNLKVICPSLSSRFAGGLVIPSLALSLRVNFPLFVGQNGKTH